MGFGNDNVNYSIVKGQAYTEDHVLVYNLFVFNIAKTTSEVQALNYFKQFGEVLKVRLMMDRKNNKRQSKIGFINFADSKVAAKVLLKDNHRLGNRKIGLTACYSWQQPGAQTAESIRQATDDAKSAGPKGDTETEKPSCSNSQSIDLNALILNLNDDCLEQICKNLIMRDQINFARTCRRFSDVFIMLSKVEYKMLVLDKLESLTLWQIRQFLEMAGPQIESLVGELPTKELKRIVEFLGSYCINTKRVNIYSTKLKYPGFLRKLIGKMNLCNELELHDVNISDNSIPIIKCMPNLKILKLEENCELTGKHICDFTDIEVLSLNGSRCIHSSHFKEICKNLTNLRELDIRNCLKFKLGDFKEMAKHLNKLESLKFTTIQEPYECIAQLPKLKRLEILDVDRYRPIRHQLFVELVKHQSEQLEELIIMSRNSLNLEKASLIGDLKKLKKLCCGNNESLNDQCLEKFSQLIELEEINLKNCNAFTNNGLLNLLKHCHKLNRLNIIRCKSLTNAFVFDALKLLQKQEIQMQRKGPVLLLANRTNIDKFVAETPEFKSFSDLMKVTFEYPFFDYKFFDDFEEFYNFSDDSEFEDDDDDDDLNFAGAYIDSDDDDFYMYYSDDDDDDDINNIYVAGLEPFNLFNRFHNFGDDINDILW